MSFNFRKSIKFGPGRLTFSKSGVSYSIGTKGARITTGPRGTYVTLGLHGLYYRQRITSTIKYRPPTVPGYDELTEPLLHTITSEAIDQLTDSDSKAFVEELNAKTNRISYFRWFCLFPATLFLICLFVYFSQDSYTEEKTTYFIAVDSLNKVNVRQNPNKNGNIIGSADNKQYYAIIDTLGKGWSKIKFGDTVGYIAKQYSRIDSIKTPIHTYARFETNKRDLISLSIIGAAFFIYIGIVFYKQDKQRLLVEIYYEIDDHIKEVYDKFLRNFTELLASQKVWQYLHAERTSDYKHHAGAGKLITRISIKRVSTNHKPAPFFRTNIPVPNIKLRNSDLYFFPERLIIKRDKQFAAIFYKHLRIDCADIIFIEDEPVASDAQVVDYTWRFLNKNGTPDRRFNNNRRLPKCLYSQYHINSGTGVNEIITTSKQGAFNEFAHIVKAIAKLQQYYAAH
ncbi:DUF4236 domain-containing protein [Puia dinghuensis]|uniref:SH3b domain-containing protein n=1 Tax=Puia dinghuensis TaxID=1792502 RepID=A0A8J2U6G3_9BACT|nr:DUF4236 domain-containing protein [Puia dinghuensis]GGA81759.1 hypothetical protein GCM10011511_00880 [Puia dinghuensis]